MTAEIRIEYNLTGTPTRFHVYVSQEGVPWLLENTWRCVPPHLGVTAGTWEYFRLSAKIVLYGPDEKPVLTFYDLPLEALSPLFPFDAGDTGQAHKHTTAGTCPHGGHDWECMRVW